MRRNWLRWALGLIAVGALLVGVGTWYLFFRDDAPPPASIDSAIVGLEGESASGVTATEDDPSGIWTVDLSVSTPEGESTFAGFRVDEELTTLGSTTAVGRTEDVTGTVTIDGSVVSDATFIVDLTTVQSDESRRNDKIQGALETSEYPTATFVLTDAIDLGSVPQSGETVDVAAVGDLTIHGVTQPVELALSASVQGDVLVVVGSSPITFADYGVETPSAPIVVSVADQGTIEFQLYLTQEA